MNTNTFYNYTQCIYTAQGKVVCQTGASSKNPVLERFVERPNETESPCMVLTKKINDAVSSHDIKCNTQFQSADPYNCSFSFSKCQR